MGRRRSGDNIVETHANKMAAEFARHQRTMMVFALCNGMVAEFHDMEVTNEQVGDKWIIRATQMVKFKKGPTP